MKTLTKSLTTFLMAGSAFLLNPASISAKSPLYNRFAKTGIVIDKNESFTVTLHQLGNSQTVRLFIYKTENKRLYISLKDAEGTPLSNFLTEKSAVQFAKDYNFEQADEGSYTLEISDGRSKVTRKINIKRIHVQDVTNLSLE
ncbi:MAG: hypothetical protein ABUT20_34015 [Bacteroidota bacterium]